MQALKSYHSVFPYVCLQSDLYNALHLAVEQEDLTSLHIVEFIASNRSVHMYACVYTAGLYTLLTAIPSTVTVHVCMLRVRGGTHLVFSHVRVQFSSGVYCTIWLCRTVRSRMMLSYVHGLYVCLSVCLSDHPAAVQWSARTMQHTLHSTWQQPLVTTTACSSY